jgi:hypothetical protein
MEQEFTQRNEPNAKSWKNYNYYSPKKGSSQRKDKFTKRKRTRDYDIYEDKNKREDNRSYYKSHKSDDFSNWKSRSRRENSHDFSSKTPNINVVHFNFRKYTIKILTLNRPKIVKIFITKITL